MKKINWGVIGLGNIAQKFLASFSKIQNSKLLAVASKDSDKLDLSKKKFDIKNKYIFNDYEKLIKCNEIDIVYISLPNSQLCLHHLDSPESLRYDFCHHRTFHVP